MPAGSSAADALRPQRQADVGRADHLARQRADRGTGLAADHGPADLLHHRGQAAQAAADRGHGRAHLRRHLAEFPGVQGEHAAHRLDGLGRDRIAQLGPHRQRGLHPFRPAPGLRRPDPGRERGDVTEPQVGQPQCLVHLVPLAVEHAGVALGHDRVPGHVLGQVPVHRAAPPGHQVGELAQRVRELLRVAQRAERAEAAPPAPGGLPGSRTAAAGRQDPCPGHPAARSRREDQPSLRPLGQDGRVMFATLSREQHTLTIPTPRFAGGARQTPPQGSQRRPVSRDEQQREWSGLSLSPGPPRARPRAGGQAGHIRAGQAGHRDRRPPR